jgi:hypothetical protein
MCLFVLSTMTSHIKFTSDRPHPATAQLSYNELPKSDITHDTARVVNCFIITQFHWWVKRQHPETTAVHGVCLNFCNIFMWVHVYIDKQYLLKTEYPEGRKWHPGALGLGSVEFLHIKMRTPFSKVVHSFHHQTESPVHKKNHSNERREGWLCLKPD